MEKETPSVTDLREFFVVDELISGCRDDELISLRDSLNERMCLLSVTETEEAQVEMLELEGLAKKLTIEQNKRKFGSRLLTRAEGYHSC